jgi:hypothetical protein
MPAGLQCLAGCFYYALYYFSDIDCNNCLFWLHINLNNT